MSKPVGYGLFVDGKCLSIGQHPSSGHVGGKSYRSQPLYTEPQEDYFADACRLAMELECLLLDCKDTAVSAKWWESANEALDQHRERIEQMRKEQE